MLLSDMRFRRLGYIALNVTDLDKSRDFYEAKLGLRVDQPAESGQLFLQRPLYVPLAQIYKQINAPLGALGQFALNFANRSITSNGRDL